MLLSEIDFKGGALEVNASIDTNIDISKQLWELNEDILHVSYKFNYFINVGWYPEFELNGCFKVVIGKDNWDDLISEQEASLGNLIELIEAAVLKVVDLVDGEKNRTPS